MNNSLLSSLILSETATLRDAMLSFEKTALQVVLICDSERRLIGLATEGDVRRALLGGHGLVSELLPFVNRKPVVGRDSMTNEELLALLSEKIRFVPVLDENDTVRDILFYDKRTMIPVATPLIGERELRYVTDALLSGWISSKGKYIEQFEKQFAEFCKTKHAVAVSNGTVALHLSLTALGIGPGDEVIVPALTFVATAGAVRHCHAKPVFVDIEESTWNIDPEKIEGAITPKTKAIIPVHLYGMPCRMDTIMAIAKKHGLRVVEDAAEAHGAEYQNKRVGSFGHMGCFSFFGNKIITTGEGGMVVTNDDAFAEKLKILRDHGMNPQRRYWHDVVGFNYRMTNVQAAIGVAQLERWDLIIEAKDRIQKWYDTHITKYCLTTTKPSSDMRPVCWLYTVLLNTRSNDINRDTLINILKSKGIDCRPTFSVVPAMPPYFEEYWGERYKVARIISEQGFSLPSSVEMNIVELGRVTETLGHLLVMNIPA